MFMWMVDILNVNFEPITFCRILFVLSILVSVSRYDHVQSAKCYASCHRQPSIGTSDSRLRDLWRQPKHYLWLIDRYCVKCATLCLRLLLLRQQKNENVAGNSYTKYFGIILRSCARKITKPLPYM